MCDPAKFSLLILFDFPFTGFVECHYAANMNGGRVLCIFGLELHEKERQELLSLAELEAIQVVLDISLMVRVAEGEADEC